VDVTEKSSKTGRPIETRRLGDTETGRTTGSTSSINHRSESPSLQVSKSPRLPSPTLHSPLPTQFVGLRYDHPIRFDRIRIFLAKQEKEGGAWTMPPKLYILKNPVDTNQTSPEKDAANWQELQYQPFFGAFCSGEATPGPGAAFEISLIGLSMEARTGYGWAVGGAPGNGTKGYVSITELRAYTTPDGEKANPVNKQETKRQSSASQKTAATKKAH
jgi:hypothetical protein